MTETMSKPFDVISGLALGFGAVVVATSLISALLTLLAIANALL